MKPHVRQRGSGKCPGSLCIIHTVPGWKGPAQVCTGYSQKNGSVSGRAWKFEGAVFGTVGDSACAGVRQQEEHHSFIHRNECLLRHYGCKINMILFFVESID